jgi:carboxyl-terminal processing protease
MKSNRARLAFVLASLAALFLLTALGAPVSAPGHDTASKALSIFADVFTLTKSNYVEAVDTRELLNGAYDGMTDAVDPYTSYIAPEQLAEYRKFRASHDVDPGLVLERRGGYSYVVAPVPGLAADRAGVKTGDFLLKVGGQSTRHMPLWEVESRLAGPPGSKVELVLSRNGDLKPAVTMTLQAGTPTPVSVEWKNDVAVVRVPYFAAGTSEMVRQDLDEARRRGASGVILDLRDDPGGSEQEAVRTASLFVPSGPVARLSGRHGPSQTFEASGPTSWTGKAVILVDDGTAGAPEIVAGALHDRLGVKLVGETTAGRAIVQKFVPTPSGGGVEITVSRFETPDGHGLDGKGLKPDERVDVFPEDTASGADPILERGLELIRGTDSTRQAA